MRCDPHAEEIEYVEEDPVIIVKEYQQYQAEEEEELSGLPDDDSASKSRRTERSPSPQEGDQRPSTARGIDRPNHRSNSHFTCSTRAVAGSCCGAGRPHGDR